MSRTYLARPLSGKSLYDHFSSVVSASGHDLGYTGDLQVTIHPVDRTGKPSRQGFPIRVHIVSKYDGGGLLIGTQQHILWQLETSYKTGLKAITAEGGAVVTFPFSVKTDGTPIGPVKVLTGRQAPPEGATALDADRALSACIAAATQVMANGVDGAYGSALMESTPDVALGGTQEDLDRFATLTEEIQQEATSIALGAPTRGPLEAEPRPPEEDGWEMVQSGRRKSPKKPPARSRNHVRQAASLLASFALLSATVWAATIAAVAVSEGMIPAGTHSWDHGAIQKSRRFDGGDASGPKEVPPEPPEDSNEAALRAVYLHGHSASSSEEEPEVGTWAEWRRDQPADFDGRAKEPFSLDEVAEAINRVDATCALVKKVRLNNQTAVAPDVIQTIWQELKLDNNPKLACDAPLRKAAATMIGEVAVAFHKPDPLLRPILNRDGSKMEVHVHTHDERPLNSRMYRVSPDRLPAMRDKLNEMMKQGVIRRSHSSWSSPLVFVPKPPGADGKPKWRCTVDMRQLNKKTVPYKYPTPHIDDLVQCCGYTEPELVDAQGKPAHVADDFVRKIKGVTYTGPRRSRVWGHCDFFESFHEVEVAEGSRHKFAFQSPTHGLCEYVRLPMGWINSPSILQAVVQDICREIYDGPGAATMASRPWATSSGTTWMTAPS